jgi:capsid protein
VSTETYIVDPAFGGAVAARSAGSSATRYETHPDWMHQRHWEAGETTRLNEAHWARAQDAEINDWLRAQLTTLRARSSYETRQNPLMTGICNTLADDVVGPDGPRLEVQSDDPAYNEALERLWQWWFSAPTFRRDVSGAALLKLWVRNLPRCGEFFAQIDTDRNAIGPVQMRLRLIPPRRIESPVARIGPRHCLGIDLDQDDRPQRYWVKRFAGDGYSYEYVPVPPDLMLHGFFLDEEGQARGFPWFTPSLQAAADLRDYDDQVQDAARLQADQHGLLYTEHLDAVLWTAPESATYERRTLKMVPPGWKPMYSPATQPAVQYPEYRAERQREIGRPFNMPLMMVRLDSSKHNYSSARLDTQSYNRAGQSIQCFLSGTPNSAGYLNYLVDLIAAEARFTVAALRKRPQRVVYIWTWQPRGHVDPTKEADAETTGLESQAHTLIDVVSARGKSIEQHMQSMRRVIAAYDAAPEVPRPAWLGGGNAASGAAARDDRRQGEKLEAVEEEEVAE